MYVSQVEDKVYQTYLLSWCGMKKSYSDFDSSCYTEVAKLIPYVVSDICLVLFWFSSCLFDSSHFFKLVGEYSRKKWSNLSLWYDVSCPQFQTVENPQPGQFICRKKNLLKLVKNNLERTRTHDLLCFIYSEKNDFFSSD